MATEQRTSPEQRRALRARYTPEPVPTCAYCHRGPMVRMPPQPMDPSYVHWRCPHDNYGTTTSVGQPEIVAACDDAAALAGARAEVDRLRAALAFVLDEMEGCEGRQGMWEDGIDPDYRRAIEHGRAALKTGPEGASE